ncbi:MAG: EI24 domain-containing protein [Desulfomonile tiedjei]|nr:EI24 domain-containing protein [Desulfomonile tiedjei]
MKEKKQVSAKEVVADIRDGMTDEQLMAKHQLTLRGLGSLKNKLLAARYLSQEELDRGTPSETPPPSSSTDKKAFARAVTADIKAGASDPEIAEKYSLPVTKIPGLIDSLTRAGYLTVTEVRGRGTSSSVEIGETPPATGSPGHEEALPPDREQTTQPDDQGAELELDVAPQQSLSSEAAPIQNRESFGIDTGEASQWSAELLERDYEVDPVGYLKQGWAIFLRYLGGFIGATALLFVILFILGFIPVVGPPVGWVLSTIVQAGFFVVALKIKRGGTPEFSDFFTGTEFLLQLVLGSLVSGAFITIGMFFLLLPGIYLAVAYLFMVPLLVDKRMFFWNAMETSRKLITRKWFPIFGFCLLLFGIQIVGALLFGLGLLATIPIAACATAAAYDNIREQLDTEYEDE